MPRHARVPDQLRLGPFQGSAAVGRGLLTRRQLASRAWVRILRDVYRHVDLEETDRVRAEALRLVLPADGVVRGRSAAWLHGVWRPAPGTLVPLEFARPTGAAGSSYDTARKRRLRFLPTMLDAVPSVADGCFGDLTEIHGTPTTSALRTCFELMRDRALVEAVVVADAFASSGAVSLPWLAAYVDLHRRWPGVRQARLAADLASSYSRSPGESRLRMIIVLGGLPEPLVNVPMFVGDPGRLVGVPDLLLVATPRVVGLEYDGAYHDEAEQHAMDNRRENRFASDLDVHLLRFGAVDVRMHYRYVLELAAKASGWRRTAWLDDADFRRPPPHLTW